MRKVYMTNAEGRDATVVYTSPKSEPAPKLGLPDAAVGFRKYLSSTPEGLHAGLVAAHGEDYAQQLIDGDPEVDMEVVGRRISKTSAVFLDSEGNALFAPPKVVELILAPDGSERDRRDPEDTPANVNEELPLRWTKMRLARKDVVRRFAFRRTIQIRHVDGLSYDYLFAMAKELHEADEVVYIGAGPKGKDALVFQDNGSPYRGFLEGRVDGAKYMLLLHLSSLELKRPKEESA